MKTELPKKSKAHEASIHEIRDVILENYKDKIVMIILFGSFARGDWVYDEYVEDGIQYDYASDYDVLVLINGSGQKTKYPCTNLKHGILKKLNEYRYPYASHSYSVIVESVQRMNNALEKGQYFFSDIKKEGVLLYDSGKFELSEAKTLSKAEMLEMAQDYFEQWFVRGKEFLEFAIIAVDKEYLNNSAFQLHQATENLLNCALLVLTGYKPKSHDLEELLSLCASQSNQFLGLFLTATSEEKKCFELLQEAYIGARYDKNYIITKKQLAYLIARVEKLRDVVETLCSARIQALNEN